jgi:hypothetical protein
MRLKIQLNIPSDGLVLEIGGGAFPHPLSDVLVDRYIEGKIGYSQRGRAPLVIGNRTIINADGSKLPFANQFFNYVICSHVIEHIPLSDIDLFIKEMSRVALSGYIEAPSILYEAIRDIPEHIWYVVCKSGTIHLCQKTSASKWQPFLNPLFEDGDFRSALHKHADLFFTGFEWKNSVQFQIHHNVEELISLYPNNWAQQLVSQNLEQMSRAKKLVQKKELIKQLCPPLFLSVSKKIKDSLEDKAHKRKEKHPGIDWKDIVVCPMCYSRLSIDLSANKITCLACQSEYSIRPDGIPSFV